MQGGWVWGQDSEKPRDLGLGGNIGKDGETIWSKRASEKSFCSLSSSRWTKMLD